MIIRRVDKPKPKKQKRTVAYIRTSTKMEAQNESYETQYVAYKKQIEEDDDLVFAGIYADRKSATTDDRPGFQQMLADAEMKKFDLVLVKSVSRFSRNVGVTQRVVDHFRELGITIIFEAENIHSDDYSSNFSLALIGAVRQDESHSISKNVAMGYHARFARGEYNLGNNRILGYDTVNGKLEPNDDAWIVKEIFERYLSGDTMYGIAKTLNEKGIRTLKGKEFSLQSVRYILKNETYVGDKHLQKKQPRDYVTKKPDPNVHVPDYYLTDDHTPIVDRETWDAVQRQLKERIQIDTTEHHPFYGKIICGECGTPFKRRTLSKSGGEKYKAWNCGDRQKGTKGNGCKCRIIKEDELVDEVCSALGWTEFDDARFEKTVERVAVFDDRIEVEMKEAMSA